jgi:hypothetical protein
MDEIPGAELMELKATVHALTEANRRPDGYESTFTA